MIPTPGKGVDAVNFRSLKESESVDISRTKTPNNETSGDVTEKSEDVVDPFGEFNSGTYPPNNFLSLVDLVVTLHYDGDDYHNDELFVKETRAAIAEA
jgi:protein-serine/threonine kinase